LQELARGQGQELGRRDNGCDNVDGDRRRTNEVGGVEGAPSADDRVGGVVGTKTPAEATRDRGQATGGWWGRGTAEDQAGGGVGARTADSGVGALAANGSAAVAVAWASMNGNKFSLI
jgi:hypothetical protein